LKEVIILKSASCKQKGRRLQKWIAEQISRVTGIPHGKGCLIESREMSLSGSDIKLHGEAAARYPFCVEAKNVERLSINAAINQAKANQGRGQDWQVFWKCNGMAPVVIMDAGTWFDFYARYLELANK
jgi:hypothetical protein